MNESARVVRCSSHDQEEQGPWRAIDKGCRQEAVCPAEVWWVLDRSACARFAIRFRSLVAIGSRGLENAWFGGDDCWKEV